MKQKMIWVDEAGRWAWAGPVFAGACIFLDSAFRKTELYRAIGDSKALTPKARDRVFEGLMQAQESGVIACGVGAASAEEVDRLGIKEANRTAMLRALQEILSVISEKNGAINELIVLIDGNDHYQFPEIGNQISGIGMQYSECIRGDSRHKEIGAASILAKVSRDRHMDALHTDFPQYGFQRHKWYGTRHHMESLGRFGVTDFHRKSYSPIKHLILLSKKL